VYEKHIKRIIDFILAVIGVIVFWPLMLILTIWGCIVMKGNPFFVQLRPGKDERLFTIVKFRTMTNERDSNGELLPDCYRLKTYGKFLRATSADELPELFNIIKGEMAIIGPRPLLVRDMVFMSPSQRRRHTVRPGLGGLAQVNGRNGISWETKLDWDVKYIEDISFSKDIELIFRTIKVVFEGSNINREGTASDMDLGDCLLKQGDITHKEYEKKQAEAKSIMLRG